MFLRAWLSSTLHDFKSLSGMGTRSIRTPSGPVTLSDVALFRAIPSDIVSLGRLIAAGWHFHAVGAARMARSTSPLLVLVLPTPLH
jgi:hypothetical protein